MAAPTENLDANGKVVSVGNGAVLTGEVTAISNGQATILLTDAYGVPGVSVTTAAYNIRQQKLKQ